MDLNAKLHIIDYIILAGYFLMLIGIGTYFSKRGKTEKTFFTGTGGFPSWAIGLSILATLISSVSFLAYPGESFHSNWILLVQGLMVPIVLIFLIWFIVPLYRKVIGVSTYEYFEKRFGYGARLYTSLAFVFAIFSSLGTVLFLISLTLSQMLGINSYIIIWALGLAVILYTILGGLDAIIWLDVIQGSMLIIGGIISLIFLFSLSDMQPLELIKNAYVHGKIGFQPYDWDFTNLTFWVIAINGIFYAVHKYATDQTMVQRYLAADTDKEAIKASLMGILLSVPVWTLFMLIGTALWSYYTMSSHVLPDIRPDAVFPYFIMTVLPPGITGLIIACLMAAGISSLDSELNSLSAVCVEDYYCRLRPDSSAKERLYTSKVVTFIAGIIAIGIGSIYTFAGNETVLNILFTFYAIFSGGIVGLFLLGALTTRANKKGVYIGIIVCVLFTGYAVLTSTPVPMGDGKSRLLIDFGSLNYSHSKYMLGVYSHIILFVVGYFTSFFFESDKEIEDLTIYEWIKDRKRQKASNKL